MRHKIGRVLRPLRRVMRLAADLTRSHETRTARQRELFWNMSRRYASAVEVEHHGRHYLVNPRDPWISRDLFLTGRYESESIDNVCAELARRNLLPDQVLDVGANIGFVTVDLLARLPQATAVAFEPDATNYRLLRQNLVGNCLDHRVVTHRLAISDVDGPLTLELSESNPGDHRVRMTSDAGTMHEDRRSTVTVQGRRLDSLMASNTLLRTDRTLVWMDIQGHEASALAGFGGLLRNPTVVELWPYGLKCAGALEQFCDLVCEWPEIIEVGRTLQPLTREELGRRVEEIELAGGGYHTDLLLIPGAL
jgi:FkbM family methyltransferase